MTSQERAKCDACGLRSGIAECVFVRTINGGLTLCRVCLDEINRKSTLLAAAVARVKMLEGQRERLSKIIQYLSSECEDGPGTKRCEMCVGCRVTSVLASLETNP